MWFICYPDITPVKELPFYTISVGMHLWQYPTPRENGYPYPQFLYSNKGSGKLITEGKTHIIPEHYFFLPMFPTTMRRSRRTSGTCAGLCLTAMERLLC